jgi:3D (Asp-Asp-Asp) domain-containing protein
VQVGTRWLRHAAVLGLLLFGGLLQQARADCGRFLVTGYASVEFPGRTADGTPTLGSEWTLLAAHPRIPFNTAVWIEGLGRFRVADRGHLGWDQLDVLVRTRQEALALTGQYTACLEFG